MIKKQLKENFIMRELKGKKIELCESVLFNVAIGVSQWYHSNYFYNVALCFR